MTKTRERGLMGLLLTLLAVPAVAQTTQLNLVPDQFPRWESGASWGPFYDKYSDQFGTGWNVRHDIRFDLGHYWTTHLKSEVGVSAQWWQDSEFETIPTPGSPLGAPAFIDLDSRQTSISPTFTYQFLENTFAHPFVSGGARIDIIRTHAYREERLGATRGITYTIPAVDEHTTSVKASPFVGAGFKSYFNDRVFLKSEALMGLSPDGPAQFGLRLGVGVDF